MSHAPAPHSVQLHPLSAPRVLEPAALRLKRPGSSAPRVMLVSEAPLLRLAIGRELASEFELIHALGTTSADRRLDAGALPDALVVDLDTAERTAVPAFLVRLVERGFVGPRVLVSAHFRPEPAAEYSASCLTHFALARPWRPGALRELMESVLHVASPRAAAGAR